MRALIVDAGGSAGVIAEEDPALAKELDWHEGVRRELACERHRVPVHV